jgi:hypothetical protein
MAEWTQERHDKCKQAIAKSTPGPWFGNSYGEMFSAKDCTCWPDDPEGGGHFVAGCPYYDSEEARFPVVPIWGHEGSMDMVFVEVARNHLPDALVEIERLRTKCDELKRELIAAGRCK